MTRSAEFVRVDDASGSLNGAGLPAAVAGTALICVMPAGTGQTVPSHAALRANRVLAKIGKDQVENFAIRYGVDPVL